MAVGSVAAVIQGGDLTTSQEYDAESLAALLDGRLSAEARARVLETLARSDAALEAFAETARFQFEASQPTEVRAITDRKTAKDVRWRRLALPAAAAAALLLVVSPFAIRFLQGPAITLTGTQLGAALGPTTALTSTLGPNWDDRTWSVTRGGAARLVEPELAFRLGVRSVDLQVALTLGETRRADRLVSEMRDWLGQIQMAQPVTARFIELQTGLTDDTRAARDLAARAERDLGEFLATPRFTFGKWCAAAELATRVHRGSFFESDLTTDFLDQAAGLGLADQDIEALRQIVAITDDGVSDAEFPELQELLRTIIARNAG